MKHGGEGESAAVLHLFICASKIICASKKSHTFSLCKTPSPSFLPGSDATLLRQSFRVLARAPTAFTGPAPRACVVDERQAFKRLVQF
jgi:hypothetical protein